MKGKYGRRADNQRDRQQLIDEAYSARTLAEIAARDRALVMEQSALRIEQLQSELADLRRHLAEQSSPEVARLRSQVEAQREEITQLRKDAERRREIWGKSNERIIKVLARMADITPFEAGEVLNICIIDEIKEAPTQADADPDDLRLVDEAIFRRDVREAMQKTRVSTITKAHRGELTQHQGLEIERSRGLRRLDRYAADVAAEILDEAT